LASYEVEFLSSALKEVSRLPPRDARRVMDRALLLAGDPRPRGCVKLQGTGRYRIRQGVYRVIYEIRDEVLLITVVMVAHRRDAYR
jgi:mRNA interferase RelE/StbE